MLSYTEQADIIDNAADRIERLGWFNPRKGNIEGECIATAVVHEARSDDEVRVIKRRLEGFIGTTNIPSWNDSHSSPQPVLDAMRACAKELRVLDDLI